jgi:hypothetical protein
LLSPYIGLNRESERIPTACGGVSERILKKTAFLKVEDALQLAAGIFNSNSNLCQSSAISLIVNLQFSSIFFRARLTALPWIEPSS